MSPHPEMIGIIGGSGFYSLLDDATEVPVSTPYGDTSDVILTGSVDGRPVAFLPRHGRRHTLPPGRINHRANLWALRSVGVRRVLASCAVHGLQPDLGPGTLVVPDQLVNRTGGRANTFYDGQRRPDGVTPNVVHLPFADPYCEQGRKSVITCAELAGHDPVPQGTMVVIQGPQFSTRAESQWHRRQGWSVVGMTGHPEAPLARELAMCYTSVALVTDVDAGGKTGDSATARKALAEFAQTVDRLRELMLEVVTHLPHGPCECQTVLDGLDTGLDLP